MPITDIFKWKRSERLWWYFTLKVGFKHFFMACFLQLQDVFGPILCNFFRPRSENVQIVVQGVQGGWIGVEFCLNYDNELDYKLTLDGLWEHTCMCRVSNWFSALMKKL